MKRKFLGIPHVIIGVAVLIAILTVMGLVLGAGSYFHSFQFLLDCQNNFFCQPTPAQRAPSAYPSEATYCAKRGVVWDEVNHTCVPAYVLNDRVANQSAPREPGCRLDIEGTYEKGKTRRDISILGGLEARGSALILTPISDAPMIIAYDTERGYMAMYFDHPETAISLIPAEPMGAIRFERHCGSGILYMEFVYDGTNWWQLVPNPREDVEITIDTTATPQSARGCVTMVWTLVDEIVVRTQTTGAGETFVASVPGLPRGYHELTESQAAHVYKTADGNTMYEVVGWAGQNTYLAARQNNIVRIDSWLPDEQLKEICSK